MHVQARLKDQGQYLMAIIGAAPEGKKELVGLIDGVRESAQSWRGLPLDLKRRGLAMGPDLAVADASASGRRSSKCGLKSAGIRAAAMDRAQAATERMTLARRRRRRWCRPVVRSGLFAAVHSVASGTRQAARSPGERVGCLR